MSAAATTPRLLTIDEVAARLHVHRVTAYRMVHDGRLPAVRFGGDGASLRVDERELEAWLYGVPIVGAPGIARVHILAERDVPSGQSTASALAGLEERRG